MSEWRGNASRGEADIDENIFHEERVSLAGFPLAGGCRDWDEAAARAKGHENKRRTLSEINGGSVKGRSSPRSEMKRGGKKGGK